MKLRALPLALLLATQFGCATGSTTNETFSNRDVAAVHEEVTPFSGLSGQLLLSASKGQTYLSFMKNAVKPKLDSFDDVIRNADATRARNYSALQGELIGKKAGVAIRIDQKNYVLNVGYLDGSDQKNDVKSGRSYGIGPTGVESDPSDLYYLKELENYFKAEPEHIGDFTRAIMLVLTNCDTSGWATLSDLGQTVATDFIAIYTAESDRHIMVDLAPKAHPWEIDLAAATFVSPFNVASGKMPKRGHLANGSIRDWWAKGHVGSGIGETRKDRIQLTSDISKVVSNNHSDLPGKFAAVLKGVYLQDPIQDTFVYLNAANGPMDLTEGDQWKVLTDAMVEYVQAIRDDAQQIASSQ